MPDSEHGLRWEHIYLLGWYDQTGRSYLTTWEGGLPMLHVVVTGADPMRMPLWGAPVPPSVELHSMPENLSNVSEFIAHATSIGGYYAFGWYMPATINRNLKEQHHAAG